MFWCFYRWKYREIWQDVISHLEHANLAETYWTIQRTQNIGKMFYSDVLLFNSLLPNDKYMRQWSGIGWGTGLSPIGRQTISWTSSDLLSIDPRDKPIFYV